MPPMPFTLPFPIRYLLFGATGVAMVIAGTVGGFLYVRLPVTLAEITPAETDGFWHQVRMQDLRRFSSIIPKMESIPALQQPFDLTIEGIDWVIIPGPEERNVPAPYSFSLRGTTVITSLQNEEMFAKQQLEEPGSLSKSPKFRSITASLPEDAPFAYLPLNGPVAYDLSLTEYLLTHRYPSKLLTTSANNRAVARVFLVEPTPADAVLPDASLPLLSPTPTLMFALADPVEWYQGYQSLFSADQWALKEAQLTHHIRALLGTDVSWTFDVLPLFRSPSTVALTMGSGGTVTSFFAEGTAKPHDLQRSLPVIESSMRAQLGSSAVSRTTFEDAEAVVLRHDPDAVTSTEESRQGWSIRSVLSKDSQKGFVSAVRGNRFIITNDAQWFSQRLENKTMELPGGFGGTIAAGFVSDRSLLHIRRETGGILPLFPLAAGPLPASFVWSMEQRGQVMQVQWQDFKN